MPERDAALEAALGRAQLGAITEDATLSELAAGQLLAVGIDPAPFTAAARRVVERAALAGPEAFTVAEVRVLGRLARGMSHREIETDLGLARRGASRSITAVYGKLGVTGRVHAARVAAERAVA
ncbi:MAG: LuxR C-terminal-related transcriptional regulator [Chloroflexi bacterium]|nr:LuxR C-terminal-related transcriptional regulator [Chloroflexota bacterium]MDA1145879.1 LuxR C-terminal-related transcriptional regulator [Chloroflexota bacterium]